MKWIAAPMTGGTVSSTLVTLIAITVLCAVPLSHPKGGEQFHPLGDGDIVYRVVS